MSTKAIKYMPGPWIAGINPTMQGTPVRVMSPSGPVVFLGQFGQRVSEETMATASLIAAAPELYAALKAIVESTEDTAHDCDTDALVSAARTAIAKAER